VKKSGVQREQEKSKHLYVTSSNTCLFKALTSALALMNRVYSH
jgi:hypothetical protein